MSVSRKAQEEALLDADEPDVGGAAICGSQERIVIHVASGLAGGLAGAGSVPRAHRSGGRLGGQKRRGRHSH
jgi:hypothetical protein